MAMYDPWLQSTQTKPPPNESTTPTLQPLRLDRAPALRGVGLFAVALGAWGLGAVTPVCEPWSVAFGSVVPLGVPKQGTCIVFEVG